MSFMSTERRIERAVRFQSFIWRQSALKLSVLMATFLLVALAIIISLTLLRLHGTTAKPLSGHGFALISITGLVCSIGYGFAYGYGLTYVRRHKTEPKLQRYNAAQDEYSELLIYTNRGLLPPHVNPSIRLQLFAEDRLSYFKKSIVWLPVLLLGVAAYDYSVFRRHQVFAVMLVAYLVLLMPYSIVRIKRKVIPFLNKLAT